VTNLIKLVGDGQMVPTLAGDEVPYAALDNAASTAALPAVAQAVHDFVPWYSSVHRGSGYKSRLATERYEQARATALRFVGGGPVGSGSPGASGAEDRVAIICRNTTEAVNHLAYRLRLSEDDVVVTTVVEHHANLLPWERSARQRRYVECGLDGTFSPDDVLAALDDGPTPRLLAITGTSNVTGWAPDLDTIIAGAHDRGVPVLVDAAQVAAHHPLPAEADYLVWSGHKMYAPFGGGVLVGPRSTFADGDPFLAGGGAVDLVDLNEVVWTDPPEREEAGSPNVIGAVALEAAVHELERIGWEAIEAHEAALARRLRTGLAAIDGVHLLGPTVDHDVLAIAAFTVDDVHHALVAARLSAEYGIGVRHGCFCAHPYLIRLLGLPELDVMAYRQAVLRGDRSTMPGAVRASCGISTTADDVDRLLAAVRDIAEGSEPPVPYEQDPATGDYWPLSTAPGWASEDRGLGGSCARG
jgi:selenocysteine lyase/cysteine desulfurase